MTISFALGDDEIDPGSTLKNQFKVETWELKNAIDILLIDDKIERRSRNGEFYFSCRKNVV